MKKNLYFLAGLISILFLLSLGTVYFALPQEQHVSYAEEEKIFPIYSTADFFLLDKTKSYAGETIRLYCDIDYDDLDQFSFTSFEGVFDGNGHAVYHASKPLFAKVKSSGEITNLIFTSSFFTSQYALCPDFAGTVKNVSFFGSHTATNYCYGIVGVTADTALLINVNNFMTLSASARICTFAYVPDVHSVTLTECGFYGTVQSLSTGLTATKVYAFVGEAFSATLTDCLFNGTIVSDGSPIDFYTLEYDCENCAVVAKYSSSPTLTVNGFYGEETCDVMNGANRVLYNDLTQEQKDAVVPVKGKTTLQSLYLDDGGYAVKRIYLDTVVGATVYSATETTPYRLTVGQSFPYDYLTSAQKAQTVLLGDGTQGTFYSNKDGYAQQRALFEQTVYSDTSFSRYVGTTVHTYEYSLLPQSMKDETVNTETLTDQPLYRANNIGITQIRKEVGGVYSDTEFITYTAKYILNQNISLLGSKSVLTDGMTEEEYYRTGADGFVEKRDVSALTYYSLKKNVISKATGLEDISYALLTSTQTGMTCPVKGAGSAQPYFVDVGGIAHVRVTDYALSFKNCYRVIEYTSAKDILIYDNQKEPVVDEESGIATNLGGGYVSINGFYPVTASLFSGNGTSAGPFEINDTTDLYKLRALHKFDTGMAYARLGGDICAYNIGLVSADLDSSDFYIDGGAVYQASTLFGSSYIGLALNPSGAFGYVEEESTTSITEDGGYSGKGTQLDPFVIRTKEELCALINNATDNAQGQYAVLGCDIYVNTSLSHGNRFGTLAKDLSLCLDGCGYAIKGLSDERLFKSILSSGVLKNIDFVWYGKEETESLIATNNYGLIERVGVSGTQEDVTSSFVTANFGSIVYCDNSLEAEHAYCVTNDGSISYSLNKANTVFAESETIQKGCTGCISRTSTGYNFLDTTVQTSTTLDYTVLEEVGYTANDVFGYKINTSSVFPVIKNSYSKYKTVSDKTPTNVGDKVYDKDTTYTLANFVVNDGSVSMTYVYNDNEPSTGIQDVGTYTLTFVYAETDEYLPKKVQKSFDITQAEPSIKLKDIAFGDIEFVYSGVTPIASAKPLTDEVYQSFVEDYGFTFTYSYTLNTVGVEEPIDVGEYMQKMSASSKNYKLSLSEITRKMSITKRNLSVAVLGSGNIDYNSETVDYSSFSAVATPVGKDITKTLEQLIEQETSYDDYTDYFTCDYQKGDNAGTEYSVVYSTDLVLKNYVLVMSLTVGVLTVQKIPVLQGDIVFYGATKDANGSYQFDYDGQEHTLTATGTVVEGLTWVYTDNVIKDASDYIATLTVSDSGLDNYIPLVLNVNVRVNKVDVTVTAKDYSAEYGYVVDYDDFEYENTALLSPDTLSSIGVTVQCLSELSEGACPSVGEYEITLNVTGTPTNYNFICEKGTLTITKVSLTHLYQNNVNGENKAFDNLTKTYDGIGVTKTITFFNEDDYTITYAYKKNGTTIYYSSFISAGTYTVIATVTPNGVSDYGETKYVCSVTIEKKQTSITLSQETYVYPYVVGGGTDYTDISYFAYTYDLPSGEVPQYGFSYLSAVHAGEYSDFVTVSYPGDENHTSCSDSATLRVTPVTAIVNVTREYEYNLNGFSISVLSILDENGNALSELSASDFCFSYVDRYSREYDFGATDLPAGNFVATPKCTNTDYAVGGTFDITVSPKALTISLGCSTNNPFLAFGYGTVGAYAYTHPDTNTAVNYVISEQADYITVKNFVLPEVNVTVDLKFKLSLTSFAGNFFDAGTYTITDTMLVQPTNYLLSINKSLITQVSVLKKELLNTWYYDTDHKCSSTLSLDYNGTNQGSLISFVLTTQSGNSLSLVDTQEVGVYYTIRNSLGVSSMIQNADTYSLRLNITNNNYSLDSATQEISVIIKKAKLSISIEDAIVRQYEQFNGARYTFTGGVGEDSLKELVDLDGASVSTVCAYQSTTAKVGDTFVIDLDVSFRNYDATVVKKGVLSVESSNYREYTITDKTFVYDGTEKKIEIVNLEQDVSVQYLYDGVEATGKKNVGEYLVIATVTYPSGRVTVSSARLTINKAKPTIQLKKYYTYFRKDIELTDDMIQGTASIDTQVVTGKYYFVKENTLETGTNSYSVRFVPTDTYNIESVLLTDKMTVVCYTVDGSLLSFAGNYIWAEDHCLQIDGTVRATLNLSGMNEIEDRLSLWQNETKVKSLVFNEEKEEVVEIKFDEEVAYAITIKVQFKKEDESQKVVMGEASLSLSGCSFDTSSKYLYVDANGGKILLDAKYGESYELYVNNVAVGSEGIMLSPDSGEVTISIKNKVLGTYVFNRKYVLKVQENRPSGEETDEEIEEQMPVYWYYIIGGVGGLVLLVVLFLVLGRKKM